VERGWLSREAQRESGKAGIAALVMREREYLVAVAERGVLAVHTLHWADVFHRAF
jgi:DNA end-binding protein Ku